MPDELSVSGSRTLANLENALCNICGESRGFEGLASHLAGLTLPDDFVYREALSCGSCGSISRERGVMYTLGALLGRQGPMDGWAPAPDLRVFETSGYRGHPSRLERLFDYFNTEFLPLDDLPEEIDGRAVANLEDLHYPDGFFDVVLTAEVLEHVGELEAAVREIYRVLAPDGHAIITVPYFHEWARTSVRVGRWRGRDVHFGPQEHHADETLVYRLFGRDFLKELSSVGLRVALLRLDTPEYAIAPMDVIVASRASFIDLRGLRRGSAPAPALNGEDGGARAAAVVRARVEAAARASREEAERSAQRRVEEAEQVAASTRAQAERDLQQAKRDLQQAEADLRDWINRAERAEREREACDDNLRVLTEHLRALDREIGDRDMSLEAMRGEKYEVEKRLARIDQSVMWRTFQRTRGAVYARIGERSVLGRGVGLTLRTVGKLTAPGAHAQAPAVELAPAESPPPPPRLPPRITFPRVVHPDVSLIIPVHAQSDLTARCLQSILAHTDVPTYEVIIVDDAADETTKQLLRRVDGARVVVNETNLHFLRSMNRGAAEARGRYLVLCNNDIEVRPGWLEALVRRADSAPDVGAVTPKFLFPDGLLQEAGGIVFQDGSAWNFGRGHDPSLPPYEYVREVDYGSAAALLVRTEAFRKVGGFDERYAPIYYEDTDLCFALREHGYRVLYEPQAEVIHVEGATSGTDLSEGAKRHQALNQPKFVEKWRHRLEAEHSRPSPATVRWVSDRRTGPEVLVVDHRSPTPDRDSGSLRMTHILRSMVELGWKVTFVPDNFERREPYTRALQEMGIEVWYAPIDFNAELRALGPRLELVLLSRPHVAPRYLEAVRDLAPRATMVYDTVDIHHVREQRRAELEGLGSTPKGEAVRELELALIRVCDATVVVTEEERRYVEATIPGARVEVLPNAHDIAKHVPPATGRSGLLFVGGFQHPPNTDAALFLVRSVMPLVWQQLGDVALTIVGPDAPREVRELASANVEVAGWVPAIEPLLEQARVMVAPLRYGAGMKGKVTQSLAAGLPVVTTPTGAEGLYVDDGEQVMIGETPGELAERIVRLYHDDELWRMLSAAGQETVDRVASTRLLRERVERLLDS